jgi:hypothetical protein
MVRRSHLAPVVSFVDTKLGAESTNRSSSARTPSLVCRFIAFSALRTWLKEVGAFVRYLKPEFFDELSKSAQSKSPDSDLTCEVRWRNS